MAEWMLSGEPVVPPGKTKSTRADAAARSAKRRLALMHQRYGHGPTEQTCGQCAFLVASGYKRTWFKCEKYRISASEATDWRKKWPTCGAFQER